MTPDAAASTSSQTTRAQKGRAKHLGQSSRSKGARQQKRSTDEGELKELERRCQEHLEGNGKETYKRFDELPLSSRTRAGLKKASFVEMTDIQAKSLPLSLAGKDILGAARTGSGKTLAFVLPVLERLYRLKWGSSDGLGALIMSPTRELAIQIFDVLKKIGGSHSFSAGLIIGGKDVKVEKDRLTRMNILVATPGRLLQHMDQTSGFDTSNVQVLVLDEADRCLDMGFENTLDAILENIPNNGRQTLLFSATQTKKVKDLARLSLSSPEYVAVNEEGNGKSGLIPDTLQQHYMIIPLEEKLSLLFSFIRTHLKSKVLVFFSSCRQVQFAYETFRKMRPGISLLSLHGKQKQTKRMQIFNDFTKTQHAILFATDIAARGLDFPRVDWVIQVDAPEDVDTYIHRVGRTARYTSKGSSLLLLLPSEEKGFTNKMKAKKIVAELIRPKESKVQDIRNQLQSFLFQDPELKYLGQKSFVSYVRSIFLQSDKSTFDVTMLPLDSYAESLGLAGAPKVKFVKEAQAAKRKAEKMLAKESVTSKEDGKLKTKYDRMFDRKNQGVLSEHYQSLIEEDDQSSQGGSNSSGEDEEGEDDDEVEGKASQVRGRKAVLIAGDDVDEDSDGAGNEDDQDFLSLKRADHALDDQDDFPVDSEAHLSKRKLLIGQSKKKAAAAGLRGQGEKMIFDEEGNARKIYEVQDEESFRKAGDAKEEAIKFIEMERERLQERDVEDKERVREKRKEKRQREKEKEREKQGKSRRREDAEEEGSGAGGAILGPIDNRDDGYETPDFDLGEDDESEEQDSGSAEDKLEREEEEEEEEEEERRPAKKGKYSYDKLHNDEDLALRLLEG
ncbi:hypothetical protein CBS101457_004138 [Exobasidium rhododendri]|nr:hypothetical protein CBS101457_004138 [Exobasidium rhododendri]